MSDVDRTGAGPGAAYPTWKNGPWPNRRCSPLSEDDLVDVSETPVKWMTEQ